MFEIRVPDHWFEPGPVEITLKVNSHPLHEIVLNREVPDRTFI